ncbi:biotin transporter BioY [Ammoniphilus sp. YIM 78166]|uniref:biotin transporter BioY n=1 Tax=Ammoniphilus sp. YIM 78166 TaxID=1644106 RepID=UPI00107067B1|nr:biotin transporter BioY [Ammoniphilus sp. YIM 78166]
MKTKNMMYVALFAAIMCVLGFLPPIPLPYSPVPITVQTLGVMLAGGILGARLGGLSLVVFLLIVAAGAPVLSGGRGGFSVLIGPSAGYLWSWPIAAFLIGYFTERFWHRLTLWKSFAINVLGGILLIYSIGVPVLAMITEMPLDKAAISAVTYIPGDLIKAFIAAYVAMKMRSMKPIIEKDQKYVA